MKRKFTQAIVRVPCPRMVNGITRANLGIPDHRKAVEQHKTYLDALRECGLEVLVLEEDNGYPDSTFIEDVAVCAPGFCVITNPGAPARNGEKHGIKNVLRQFYTCIEEIKDPGRLDGGDVMMAGNHFYIGISERTNRSGADQLTGILSKFNLTGHKIPLKKMLHLKTGLSYLEENNLLISGEFIENPEFDHFSKLFVSQGEEYAANSLWINGKVMVPKGYHGTKKNIEKAGYTTIEIDVSEFQKLDGGLSCLSLRF